MEKAKDWRQNAVWSDAEGERRWPDDSGSLAEKELNEWIEFTLKEYKQKYYSVKMSDDADVIFEEVYDVYEATDKWVDD